jgi:hypothetical protein
MASPAPELGEQGAAAGTDAVGVGPDAPVAAQARGAAAAAAAARDDHVDGSAAATALATELRLLLAQQQQQQQQQQPLGGGGATEPAGAVVTAVEGPTLCTLVTLLPAAKDALRTAGLLGMDRDTILAAALGPPSHSSGGGDQGAAAPAGPWECTVHMNGPERSPYAHPIVLRIRVDNDWPRCAAAAAAAAATAAAAAVCVPCGRAAEQQKQQ